MDFEILADGKVIGYFNSGSILSIQPRTEWMVINDEGDHITFFNQKQAHDFIEGQKDKWPYFLIENSKKPKGEPWTLNS